MYKHVYLHKVHVTDYYGTEEAHSDTREFLAARQKERMAAKRDLMRENEKNQNASDSMKAALQKAIEEGDDAADGDGSGSGSEYYSDSDGER